jgi:hypothetical protein
MSGLQISDNYSLNENTTFVSFPSRILRERNLMNQRIVALLDFSPPKRRRIEMTRF